MTTNHPTPTAGLSEHDREPDLVELRRLLDAATVGPWEPQYEGCDCGGEFGCRHGVYVWALRTPEHKQWSGGGAECDPTAADDHYHHTRDVGDFTSQDVELIAALRNAAPWLLDQVAAVARVEALCDRAESKQKPSDMFLVSAPSAVKVWTCDVRAALAGPGVSE